MKKSNTVCVYRRESCVIIALFTFSPVETILFHLNDLTERMREEESGDTLLSGDAKHRMSRKDRTVLASTSSPVTTFHWFTDKEVGYR